MGNHARPARQWYSDPPPLTQTEELSGMSGPSVEAPGRHAIPEYERLGSVLRTTKGGARHVGLPLILCHTKGGYERVSLAPGLQRGGVLPRNATEADCCCYIVPAGRILVSNKPSRCAASSV